MTRCKRRLYKHALRKFQKQVRSTSKGNPQITKDPAPKYLRHNYRLIPSVVAPELLEELRKQIRRYEEQPLIPESKRRVCVASAVPRSILSVGNARVDAMLNSLEKSK